MVAFSLSFLRSWTMVNTDTLESLVGQFEAEDLTERPGNPAYSGHNSLGRQNEVLQFLHGQADRVSFRGRVFAATAIEDIKPEIDTLKSWVKVEAPNTRPPVVVFMAGTGDVYTEAVIDALGDITYDRLDLFGRAKGATFSVTLRQYIPFEISATVLHETRYARAKSGEYFESLALSEYGDPIKGVLVRRRHLSSYLEPGDVVKLPSESALGRETIQPISIPFFESFSNKDTATKRLRQEFLDLRSTPYVSHVLR